jgi:hypothetical protein
MKNHRTEIRKAGEALAVLLFGCLGAAVPVRRPSAANRLGATGAKPDIYPHTSFHLAIAATHTHPAGLSLALCT